MIITISDVAKRAGVSKSSVSRVINGNFNHMSEDMKQKVLLAIQELNYRPNSVAQSLKKKETRVIGIVLADLAPFWSDVIKGIQSESKHHGYSLMVSDSAMDPKSEEANIQMLKSKQVDGLIINTLNPYSPVFAELMAGEVPFVFINSTSDDIQVDKVVADNIRGTTEAVEYLISLGHRRIAIMLYPIENIMVRAERLDTYRKALEANGLPLDPSLIQICKQEKGHGVKTTIELLEGPDRPTAFLTTSIYLTLEVLKGVRQAGLEVPEDISIVGFDDFEWTPLLDPPLTTVSYQSFKMGAKSCELLIKKILGKNHRQPQKIVIPPKLIIRSSAGKLRERTIGKEEVIFEDYPVGVISRSTKMDVPKGTYR